MPPAGSWFVVRVTLLNVEVRRGRSSATRTSPSRSRRSGPSGRARTNFRLLLDSTGEAIYGVDMDGRCTFCNAACLRLLGYAESRDLLGKNMHWLIHHSRADGAPYPWKSAASFRPFARAKGRMSRTRCCGVPTVPASPPSTGRTRCGRGNRSSGPWSRSSTSPSASVPRRRCARARSDCGSPSMPDAWGPGTGTSARTSSSGRTTWRRSPASPGSFDGTFEGFQRLIHPVDRESVEDAITRSIEDRSNHEVEFRVARPDGSIGWLVRQGTGLSWPRRATGAAWSASVSTSRRGGGLRKRSSFSNAELEGRLGRIPCPGEIDRAISGSLDLRFTLGVVLDQAIGQLEIDAAAVLLCRPHEASLEYAVYRGFHRPPPADFAQRLDEGPAGAR